MKKSDDKFIMLPTVDFCFCELMKNAKVRKGFVAALQGVAPELISETTLLPTILDRDSKEDKQGILDVRIREEFEDMAKTNEYLDEAYQELQHLSADDRKRLEYEAREKAIRDYNWMMQSAEEIGLERGMQKGMERGIEKGIEQGIARGEANFARLTEILLEESRMDELKKAASDKEYRGQLYEKYGIR